ncbi:ATP-dependent DNA helicase chl1 [Coemansia sp. RSA 2673]|nr:ATP-dependent DNA helicase chl1 [Coemansia sp. RSA 2673]
MASRRGAPTDVSKKRKPDKDGNDSDDEMIVVEVYYSGDKDEDAQRKFDTMLDDEGKVQYSAAVHKLLECRAGNRSLYDSSDDDNSDNNDSDDSVVPPKEPSVTKIIYDATGSTIIDIEELAKEGRRRCTCPYYRARASINGAQVVALPYNTLLSRSARQAMGISLTGNVVIIDKAHNLVNTILSIHSTALDWRAMRALLETGQMYFSKYWR